MVSVLDDMHTMTMTMVSDLKAKTPFKNDIYDSVSHHPRYKLISVVSVKNLCAIYCFIVAATYPARAWCGSARPGLALARSFGMLARIEIILCQNTGHHYSIEICIF